MKPGETNPREPSPWRVAEIEQLKAANKAATEGLSMQSETFIKTAAFCREKALEDYTPTKLPTEPLSGAIEYVSSEQPGRIFLVCRECGKPL